MPGAKWSGRERRPASAGAGRVRILKHESAAHHLVLEVDLNTIEIQVALHIAQDLYTLRFNLLVGFAFGLFGEVEQVGKPATSATLDAHAQARVLLGQVL